MSNLHSPGEGVGLDPSAKGDKFRCRQCGMELQVTADRHCMDGERVHFHCCGEELSKVS